MSAQFLPNVCPMSAQCLPNGCPMAAQWLPNGCPMAAQGLKGLGFLPICSFLVRMLIALSDL
jgi:hypothetical protein